MYNFISTAFSISRQGRSDFPYPASAMLRMQPLATAAFELMASGRAGSSPTFRTMKKQWVTSIDVALLFCPQPFSRDPDEIVLIHHPARQQADAAAVSDCFDDEDGIGVVEIDCGRLVAHLEGLHDEGVELALDFG